MHIRFSRQAGTTRPQRWRRSIGTLVATVAVTLGLTACPMNPEEVNFDTDERIIRGSYEGFVDTRLPPRFLRLNADGSIVATVWWNTIELWDRTSDEITHIDIPELDDQWVFGLSIDAAGGTLAVNNTGYVQILYASDGSLIQTVDLRNKFGGCDGCGPQHVALNPQGTLFAAAGESSGILLYETSTAKLSAELAATGNVVVFIAFSADGSLLAAASATDTRRYFQVWNLEAGEPIVAHEFAPTLAGSPSFAFSADGQWFAVYAYEHVELFGLTGEHETVNLPRSEDLRLQALNPDASQIILLAHEGQTLTHSIVDSSTGAVLAQVETDLLSGYAAWSTTGEFVVLGHRLLNASTFDVEADVAIGQYYELSLQLDSHYIAGHSYGVTGTVSIDGQSELPVSGTVYGNDTQKYLRQQVRPPHPPRLTFDIEGHPWSVSAHHLSATLRIGDPGYEHRWIGSLLEDSSLENRYYKPFEMWRTGTE